MDARLRGRQGCGRGARPHGVGTPDTSVGKTDAPDEAGDEGALLPLPAEATAAARSGPNDPGLVAALVTVSHLPGYQTSFLSQGLCSMQYAISKPMREINTP